MDIDGVQGGLQLLSQPFSRAKDKDFPHEIGVDEKQQHLIEERGHTAKKVMSLTQIYLCAFLCKSGFTSWFLMKL